MSIDNTSVDVSPKINPSKIIPNELPRYPKNHHKKRKSSIPLQIKELMKKNLIKQNVYNHSSINNPKGRHSIKSNNLKNTNIPEESGNSSLNKDDKKNKSTNKNVNKIKNEIENNNYYICYAQNILSKESHLNLENIIKNAKKNVHGSLKKYIEHNKNIIPVDHRRNSVVNKVIINSNLNKPNAEKNEFNSRISDLIVKKIKEGHSNSFLHKKTQNLNNRYTYNPILNKLEKRRKSKEKNKLRLKELNDNKELMRDIEDEKNDRYKNEENNEDIAVYYKKNNNNNLFRYKTMKERELLFNEGKTDYEDNIDRIKIHKKCKFLKLLCCFKNIGDSSIEK